VLREAFFNFIFRHQKAAARDEAVPKKMSSFRESFVELQLHHIHALCIAGVKAILVVSRRHWLRDLLRGDRTRPALLRQLPPTKSQRRLHRIPAEATQLGRCTVRLA
jgi:hypothetical protein